MADSLDDSADGRQTVRFEETLDMRDEAGAKPYIKYVYLLVLFMLVNFVVGAVLIGWFVKKEFFAPLGGQEVVAAIVTGIWAERPMVATGIGLVLMFVGIYTIVSFGGYLSAMRGAFDKQVHVKVTDSGITVQRDGNWLGQASKAAIAFEEITAVEYLDPETSSTRLELDDIGSKQFFAGRSKSWIRIERDNDPAVYIGSDRRDELTEIIVTKAPHVETAEPF